MKDREQQKLDYELLRDKIENGEKLTLQEWRYFDVLMKVFLEEEAKKILDIKDD